MADTLIRRMRPRKQGVNGDILGSLQQHSFRRSPNAKSAPTSLVTSLLLTLFVVAAFAPASAPAQTYVSSVLYSFAGGTDGAEPEAGLVQDAQGNLYGTTVYGGDLTCKADPAYGCGTVFKVDATGRKTVLTASPGIRTALFPEAGLVRDSQGNFYGTTFSAGAFGKGTVFKVDTAGNETVLSSFAGRPGGDGANPESALLLDAQGNLYGTTGYGGDN